MKKDGFDNYDLDFSRHEKKKMSTSKAVGLSLLGFVVLVSLALGARGSISPSSDSNSVAKSAPIQTQESDHCYEVRIAVTMIRSAFSEGKATPQEMSILLDSAIADWTFATQLSTGSKSEWLKKMADLGSDVKNYILTGEPSNGPQSLDQLFANMNLVDQFCG